MDVVVIGRRVEVDPALRAVTLEKLERVGKFASDARRADVDYGVHQTRKAGDSCTCEILVHLTQHLVKGSAAASEHAVALDRALDKVERQLRRLHERRVQRDKGTRSREARAGAAANGESSDSEAVGVGEPDGLPETGSGEPAIVKSKRFDGKPMTPDEAALQMGLLGHDFFLFRNVETANAAVLYKRRDGALGLIEVTG